MQNTPFAFSFHFQPQPQHSFSLKIGNRATRVNCRMEYDQPIHPPIYQKLLWQPDFSFRHFKHAPRMQSFRGDGALVNKRSQSPILPVFQGSAPSVSAPASPAFIGAPLENRKAVVLYDLAMVGVLRTAVAPLERVKLLMQNQNAMIKSGRLPQPYNGILDCFARTIRNEGIFSLWRGNTAIAIGHVCNKALTIAWLEFIKSRQPRPWTHAEIIAASALISSVNMILVFPIFYGGTRMANDVKTTSYFGKRQFKGIVDVYRKTLKSDGITGLYRGFSFSFAENYMLATLRDASKPLQQLCLLHLQKNSFTWNLAVEFGFRICHLLVAYPLDTMSRRMMMTSGEAVKYKSTLNAVAQIFKTEGVKSFYKGAGADILLNAAFTGGAVLILHVARVLFAAKEKPGDGSQPPSTLTFRWKNAGDK